MALASEHAITHRLLEENQNLALVFPVTDKQQFDLAFFRTLQVDSFYIDYDDEMPVINADSSESFQRLAEDSLGGTGSDVLDIDDNHPFTLHHFSVGVDTPNVRVYNAFTGVPQHGHRTGVQVTPGDEKGYELSQNTMTENGVPSDRLEQVKYTGPTLTYGFHNDNPERVQPRVHVMGSSYEALQITDESTQKDIIAGRKPANFITVGGLQNMSPSMPDEWQTGAIPRVGTGQLLEALQG